MVNTNTIFWYHIQYMGLLFSLTLKAYHIGTKQQTGYINFVLVVSAVGGGPRISTPARNQLPDWYTGDVMSKSLGTNQNSM